MAREEIFFGINIDTGEVIKDFGTLKNRTKELKKELDGTKVGTKRFEELKTEITRNQATIRRFNRQLRDTKSLATRVGQGMTNAFKKVGGVIAGAFAVNAIIDFTREAINTIKDFEQQIAIVGAVSGASKKELELLAESARNLGKTSLFTATEVAQLQEELAKLGFTTSEIIDASGGILDLSTAFKLDLAQAAEVTASTLNAFGLEASDTRLVVDVMADSFSSSALNLERFQEAIKLVAPAAKQTGRTLQETTALLSVLADNGISGSIAGTQLNRVFIELNKKGMTLEQAMSAVANSTDKLGTATDLVGDRGAKALSIFADQSEALQQLRDDYADVTGEAEQLALKTGDTLEGSLKRAKSAWDELILSFSGSKGILRDTVDAFSSIVNEISESSNLIGRAEEFGLFEDQFVIIDAVEAVNSKTTEALSDNQKTLRNLIKEDKRIQQQIAKAIGDGNIKLIQDLGKEAVSSMRKINESGRTELDLSGDQAMAFFNLYKQSFEDIKNAFNQIKNAKKEIDPLDENESLETERQREDISIEPSESAEVKFQEQVNQRLEDLSIKRLEKTKEVKESEKETERAHTEFLRLEQEKRIAINNAILQSSANLAGGIANLLASTEDSRRKNADLIKKFAIAEVGINTALQIKNILATNSSPTQPGNLFTFGAAGAVASAVQVASAVANGAAQIAAISSQKFAKGGILQGASHAQGGIKTPFGELEGGEAVINKKSTKKYGGILSAINEAEGGVRFERGGILGVPNVVNKPTDLSGQILSAIENIQINPTVSVVEINEAQTRLIEIENNSTL